ncbi:MAG: hypothetical protein J3Q66DRAFT_332059 [Benniella sp.]|nr:MAG: hypothetical protein J3Q66DRAFT_332059 [Benniella sp.]
MTEGFHHAHVERARAALHAFHGWIFTHTHQQDHLAARVSSYLNSLLQGRGDSFPDDFLKPPPPTYADSFGHAFRALFAASRRFLEARGQTLLHDWDPATMTHSLLWNYTPDLHTMPQRIDNGIRHLSETYDVDPKVVWLVLALPGLLLLLIVSAVMGARNRPLDDKKASVRVKLTDGKTKAMPKNRGRRASARVLQKLTGWNGRRRDHDAISWGSVIGASGFYGAELQDHTPYPPLTGKDLGQLPPGNSGIRTEKPSAAGVTLAAIATRCMADTSSPSYQRPAMIPKSKNLHHPSFMDVERNDDGMNNDPFEFMPLPSNVKRDDRRERTAGMMDATSNKDEHARRASVHRRLHAASSGSYPQVHQQQASTGTPVVMHSRSIGFKMIDWTKGNQILRDMDAISGGLLGTACSTVAALASTAKVTAGYIKKCLPDSIAGIKRRMHLGNLVLGKWYRLPFSSLTPSFPFFRTLCLGVARMRAEQPLNGKDQTIRKAALEIMEQDSMAANSFRSTSRKSSHGVSEELAPSFIGPKTYAQVVATPFRPRAAALEIMEQDNMAANSIRSTLRKSSQGVSEELASFIGPKTYAQVVATPFRPKVAALEIMEQDNMAASRTSSHHGVSGVLDPSFIGPKTYAQVVATPFRPKAAAQAVTTPSRPKAESHAVDVRADVKVVPLSYAAVVAKGIPLSYVAVVVKSVPFLYAAVVAKGCTGAPTSKNSGSTAHDKEPQGLANSSHHHGQRRTQHHLVLHLHDAIELAHQHHEGHQGTVTKSRDQHQKQRRPQLGHVVEYALDEHGNKVPMTDERRDSGFSMSA